MKTTDPKTEKGTPASGNGSSSPELFAACGTPGSGSGSGCCGTIGRKTAGETDPSGFVNGWVDTEAGPVPRIRTEQTARDLFGRWKMRWGIGRDRYRVEPRLYAVGDPDPASPVLVTANYKMTFDALRSELAGLHAWILVLDTDGVNVWCAAGKGTFGNAELARRVNATRLEEIVSHRRLILPQLGGTGVAAHRVPEECGFTVTFGPVRARDIRRFLAEGMKATAEMRRVSFTVLERLVLTPMELVGSIRPSAWAVLALFVLSGIGPGFFSPSAAWQRGLGAVGAWTAGILAGAVVTPVLLPWLPGRAFSTKGAVVGGVIASLAAIFLRGALGTLPGLALVTALPAVSSFVAMNYTGATPFTSPSGVEKEMRRAMPVQAAAAALAGIFWIGAAFAGP